MRVFEYEYAPLMFLKYIAMDFSNYCRRDTDELVLPINELNDFDVIHQFNFFTRENAVDMFKYLVNEYEVASFELLEWFLQNCCAKWSHSTVSIVYKQILGVILAAFFNINSIYGPEHGPLVVRLLTRLYSFMCAFIKQVCLFKLFKKFLILMRKFKCFFKRSESDISEFEALQMRFIVESIYKKLQMNMSYFFGRIQVI